ncbi:hypothetical protein [Lentzea sp. HUAS12]|uniref:hypothetical protein n=1 Tax=Lentzea sp. HUAS12 TaxID=2951806 RepID=UPI0020A14B0C|nr:hypothetical protein [Lentzea sp. HUAS12]USX53598.1 hypothetical protein ND450_05710 [Lentzea sp. HUAS12]
MNPDGVAEPLDDRDFLILAGVRELYEAIDPMPAEVLEEIRFSLALRHLETEIARAVPDLAAAVTRGEESRRLLAFESPGMKIALGVKPNGDGTVRLDGWLTPPGEHRVELHAQTGVIVTRADERGRFAVEGVARTPVHLTVRLAKPVTALRAVTTPTFAL